jgi:glycosyltransferase involved in cell wall biosynthesis
VARTKAATAAAPSPETPDRPRLSVCIPTYARPGLLARALDSVIQNGAHDPRRIELLVADNDPASGEAVARPVLDAWPGPTGYLGGENIGMIANFNRCISASHGEAILILHDDDRLLPGALDAIIRTLEASGAAHPVHVFGTLIVAGDGRLLRRHLWDTPHDLPPAKAVHRVLSNSSMVRFPSVVVERFAFDAVGGFRDGFGGADDLDMWVRLFSRYGVTLETPAASEYTIHPGADTESMFNATTIGHLLAIFESARAYRLLDDETLRRCRADYFHQFVLGGTYRRLLAGDRAGARTVLGMFDLPELATLGPSRRWGPVRWAFRVVVALPMPIWTPLGALARRFEARTRSLL